MRKMSRGSRHGLIVVPILGFVAVALQLVTSHCLKLLLDAAVGPIDSDGSHACT